MLQTEILLGKQLLKFQLAQLTLQERDGKREPPQSLLIGKKELPLSIDVQKVCFAEPCCWFDGRSSYKSGSSTAGYPERGFRGGRPERPVAGQVRHHDGWKNGKVRPTVSPQ